VVCSANFFLIVFMNFFEHRFLFQRVFDLQSAVVFDLNSHVALQFSSGQCPKRVTAIRECDVLQTFS
jgi:hypothetical protein